MRVIISSRLYDSFGPITLEVDDAAADLASYKRRVNRIATLDGNAVFNDFGFSYADQTVTLVWMSTSSAQETAVQRLLRLNNLLNLFMPSGAYSAAPESYTTDNNMSTLVLLVKSKLSE